MPSYTANRPDLFNNVGSYPAQGPQVDIGGAVQALTGGATSLIHATLLRKQAEFERQHQMNQEKIETDRWNQQSAWHQAQVAEEARRWDAENAINRQKTEDAARASGIVRGTPAVPAVPGEAPGPSATIAPTAAQVTPRTPGQFSDQPPVNPFVKAMTRGSVAGAPNVATPGLPMASGMKPAAPTPGATTMPTTPGRPGIPGKPATPDAYDPDYDRNLQRTIAGSTIRAGGMVDAATIRANALRDATHARLSGRLEQIGLENKGKVEAAGVRWGSVGSSNAPAAEAMRTKQAEDFLANSEQGQRIAKQYGLSSDHLFLAEGRSRGAQSVADKKQADILQRGPRGDTPAGATSRVQQTRTILRPGKKSSAAAAASSVLTPSTGSPFAKTAPTDDFTDEELADAHEGLPANSSDAKISEFIMYQRKKKKAAP